MLPGESADAPTAPSVCEIKSPSTTTLGAQYTLRWTVGRGDNPPLSSVDETPFAFTRHSPVMSRKRGSLDTGVHAFRQPSDLQMAYKYYHTELILCPERTKEYSMHTRKVGSKPALGARPGSQPIECLETGPTLAIAQAIFDLGSR